MAEARDSITMRDEASSGNSARQRLLDLVALLSDHECRQLLRAVEPVSSGERFWQEDGAVSLNELIKFRSHNVRLGHDSSAINMLIPQSSGGVFAPIPIVKTYPDAPRVILPHSVPLSMALTDTILRRRTVREYTGKSISQQQLATVLEHSAGVTGRVSAYGYTDLPLRTFPSCGALAAPEVYVFVLTTEDVPSGLYHYHPRDHVLELLREGQYGEALVAIAPGQPGIGNSAAALAITARYDRLRWKYGPRAYRYICMDVGFLGQNLYLSATALGLGCCGIAGFVDDELEALLEIDGEDEMAMLMASVGTPR